MLEGSRISIGGMGLRVAGRGLFAAGAEELASPQASHVVAHSIRGAAVAVDVPADGYILRYRTATDDYQLEALPGSASTVNVEEDGALEGAADTLDFLEPDADIVAFAGGQAQVNLGLYVREAAHGGVTPAGHHNPVTLAADAQVLLNLSTQELGLVAKAANLALMGPASGGAADPTFRALVKADLPTLKVSKSIMFHYPDEDMAVGDFVSESAIRVPAAGKHGTWTPGTIYVRCLTVGAGTNTVLFRTSLTLTGARTTRATVALGTSREASAAITWTPADGEYTWVACSAVGGTAPKRVVAQVDLEEAVY